MITIPHDKTPALPKFPIKMLTATVIITIATLFWFAYFSFHTIDVFQNTVTKDFRAIELRGEILKLDEVLTMSARMGVVTGDPKWEERYNYYDPILVKAIDEAGLIVPLSDIGKNANITNEANIKLVAMERGAFSLAKKGDLHAAKNLIFSADYEAQKKIYAEGMSQYSKLLNERAVKRLNAEIKNTYYSILLIAATFLISIVYWVLTFRSISHWHFALKSVMEKESKYKKEIEEARDFLELRVKERTAMLKQKNNELTSSKNELTASNAQLQDEIVQREKAERTAIELNSKLIYAAKRAGMSEIATSVLHNIGNILNSAKTSIGILQQNINKSDTNDMTTISKMLNENKNILKEYLFEDPKGKLIPGYIMTISATLEKDHDIIKHEVDSLFVHIKHIEDIVSIQQAVSGVAGVPEKVYLPDIIDTAIQMCGDIFQKRDIIINKNMKDSPIIMTDKSKVLQIIVNLVQNAKDALTTPGYQVPIKCINLSVEAKTGDPTKINLLVEDNGVGIKKADLISIFSMGFTTKPTGHGFGLHSSALIAKELGGELRAMSSGEGKGATFILTIPVETAKLSKGRSVTDDTTI